MQYTKQLVTCLRDEAARHNGVVDLMKWVNFLTTDVIGDLSFGEPFGGLDTGKLHPWLETLFTTLKTFSMIREILRLPAPVIKAAMACIPKKMIEHQKGAVVFGAQAAQRRMERTTDRPDFMSYILRHNGEDGKGFVCDSVFSCGTLLTLLTASMSKAELEMAAITFIVAGSETSKLITSQWILPPKKA